MSLPTSETKPDGYFSSSSNRGNLKLIPYHDATEGEKRGFIFALTNRVRCTTEHYTLLLISGAILLFALIFNSPLLLITAALIAPFLGPVVTPGLAATTPSWSRFGRALANLLITLAVFFAAGWLAGMIPSTNGHVTLPHIHLLRSTWLEWLVVALTSALTTWLFLRGHESFRLFSALLTYLVFFPVSLAGMLYQNNVEQAWLAALLLVLARLAIALIISLLLYWLNGITPVKWHGWLIAAITLVLAFTSIAAFSISKLILTEVPAKPVAIETPVSSATPIPTKTIAPATPTAPTATLILTSTATPTVTTTPTELPTPEVTPVNAWIIAPNGVIVRWQPDSKADVVTYMNQFTRIGLLGEQFVVGTAIWEKVLTSEGEIGWIMGRYLITATPLP
jgi:uncharacterized membrane protein